MHLKIILILIVLTNSFFEAYVYKVPVADAVYVDGPLKRKACSESALYARIARHKLRESPEVVGSKRKSPSESPVLDINNAVAGKSAALCMWQIVGY